MTDAKTGGETVAFPRGHILHAEDDLVAAALITRFLTDKGYHVERAANGLEALAKLLNQPGSYDLIITDHSMPELTGLGWITTLRKTGYPGKIIVLAAMFSAEVEDQFRALNVDRILWKSSNLIPLREAVEELLNAPREQSHAAMKGT